MPKERLSTESPENRKGPPEVYVTLRDLIAMQYDARGFSFLPKYAVQSLLSGRHRSKLRGRGLDFDEVRQYVAGDDIRNIDWKVTARVGLTHTKVYTEEKERPVFFVLDQSSSMFFGSQRYIHRLLINAGRKKINAHFVSQGFQLFNSRGAIHISAHHSNFLFIALLEESRQLGGRCGLTRTLQTRKQHHSRRLCREGEAFV